MDQRIDESNTMHGSDIKFFPVKSSADHFYVEKIAQPAMAGWAFFLKG
jgi:hypothetical protein